MSIPINLSLHEVSVKSGISMWSLYKAIREGELNAFKLSDSENAEYYIMEDDFNGFLERRKDATATQRSRKKSKQASGQA